MGVSGATTGPASTWRDRGSRRGNGGASYGTPFSIGNASSTGATGGATLVIPAPSGIVAGQLLVAVMFFGGVTTVTNPSGWTTLADSNTGSFTGNHVASLTAGASEPGSYTFTLNTTTSNAAGGIIAFNGATGVDGTPALNGTGSVGSTTATVNASTSTGGSRVWVAGIGAQNGVASIGNPAGFTQQSNTIAASGYNISTKSSVGSGSTGSTTSTIAPTERWGTVSLLVF